MPLKDRVRRALGRSSDSSSASSTTSSSSPSSSPSASDTNLQTVLTATTTSNVPGIALTKTTSSRLARITSWRSTKGEKKEVPWVEPKLKYPASANSRKHQEMLRGFEMKFGRSTAASSGDGVSIWSGISPMASRCGSVVDISRAVTDRDLGPEEEH